MKYNYLVSSYNSLLTKYQKYFSRLQRDINNGSFAKLSVNRKNFLIQKVDQLRMKLASLQPRLAGAVAATGLLLALNAPQAEAQFVFNNTKNPFGGSANTTLIPFAGTYSSQSVPVLVDLDGDGDKDAVVGSQGAAEYFKNTGTVSVPVFAAQTGTFNPFTSLVSSYVNEISMADLDHDGDYDLIVGAYNNSNSVPYQIAYFMNTGTTSAPAFTQQNGTFNPIATISGAYYTTVFPSFVDIDGDGDKDIFAGFGGSPNTSFLKNTGTNSTPVFVEQAPTANPLSVIPGGGYSVPTFVDIDGDGDFDAVVSNYNNSFSYYKNTGTALAPVFAAQTGTYNPFTAFSVSVGFLNSSFADLDGDGDQDMVVGDNSGQVSYYKNSGTASAASFSFIPPFDAGFAAEPIFADIDGDGDKDAVIGSLANDILYFTNNGPATAPVYTQVTGTFSPFSVVSTGYQNIVPALTDLDGDGDIDLMIGVSGGTFVYYKNTGTATAAVYSLQSGGGVPMFGTDIGSYSAPVFVDLDNDGDKDLVAGEKTTGLYYFMNTGTTSAPVFTAETGTNNLVASIPTTNGYRYTPTFVNFDGDSDMDLLVGTQNGEFYYKNTGTASAPVFAAQTGTNNPFTVVTGGGSYYGNAFEDLDNDGDIDLFVGDKNGNIRYYENTTPVVVTSVFAPLSASFSSTLSAYPNPVKDVLSFSLNDGIGSNMQVSVLDMNGSEMLSQNFENSGATMSLNVSKLNAGIYVLKLSSDAKAGVVKFVKQ